MQGLFVCTRCGCIDFVELTYGDQFPSDPAQQLCVECRDGGWYVGVEKEKYDPAIHQVINAPTGLGLD